MDYITNVEPSGRSSTGSIDEVTVERVSQVEHNENLSSKNVNERSKKSKSKNDSCDLGASTSRSINEIPSGSDKWKEKYLKSMQKGQEIMCNTNIMTDN